MNYIQVTASTELPDLSELRPFKALVIVEDAVTPERQAVISRWLVDSGCLYMMAWGEDCASWQESVDRANIETFNSGEIPDDCVVITTSHEDELLKQVFWFSKHTAMHPCFELDNTLLLHLTTVTREQELTDTYNGV